MSFIMATGNCEVCKEPCVQLKLCGVMQGHLCPKHANDLEGFLMENGKLTEYDSVKLETLGNVNIGQKVPDKLLQKVYAAVLKLKEDISKWIEDNKETP